ncbi:MAG TPA: DUF2889 domain-containing protein [Acidimicrobiales bacterium]|nr:DUF2889 domain-containing protein [Acidimicrobiales bacterium]
MLLLPEAAGPMDPAPTTPGRPPGSIRRTSSIDTARPDGLRGGLVITARARDLRTLLDGTASVVGEAELHARVDGMTRELRSLITVPALPALDLLIGAVVGPGFRRRLADEVPQEQEAGSLLYLLLDDLPGAALVSGYALQRGGALDGPGPRAASPEGSTAGAAALGVRDDLCAGWAHDATMMVTIRTKGVIPMATGPPAPVLEPPDDPWSWHEMPPLTPHAMRRRRRLDVLPSVAPGVANEVDAHFRDSHMDADGAESVVHEYSVSAAVEGVEGRVTAMAARARVLPWMECPAAVASADRLVGMPVGELRAWVRREMTGASTCTHLNDTLRALGDVTVLASVLDGTDAEDTAAR